VSTDFTSTESSRQDCPAAPTVTPPPPLILVIEGKTVLLLVRSVLHYCHLSSQWPEFHIEIIICLISQLMNDFSFMCNINSSLYIICIHPVVGLNLL
jgi:hypothetical protein